MTTTLQVHTNTTIITQWSVVGFFFFFLVCVAIVLLSMRVRNLSLTGKMGTNGPYPTSSKIREKPWLFYRGIWTIFTLTLPPWW